MSDNSNQNTKTVIGIDVGGSTTKIVGFRPDGTLISPMFVKANDPVTSAYGAFGKFTLENKIALGDIGRVMMTGVGSSFITEPVFGLPCTPVSEFESVGRGGLWLSGLNDAIIVSMGTGTALIHAKKTADGVKCDYLGGTGIGGGTIHGLAKKMLDIESVSHLEQLSEGGDLNKVDLRIKDITRPGLYNGANSELTASNFGGLSDIANRHDIALGIINMVTETIAMVAIFAARGHGVRDIVLTGNLTSLSPLRRFMKNLEPSFDINFVIPDMAQFGPVIGAALQ
ncbi:MAG: pantothenate kinase [Clostridia bacterium]|nr:pantothenate kinase [Clostridia bacterium]